MLSDRRRRAGSGRGRRAGPRDREATVDDSAVRRLLTIPG
jgi:hypothetical protein